MVTGRYTISQCNLIELGGRKDERFEAGQEIYHHYPT